MAISEAVRTLPVSELRRCRRESVECLTHEQMKDLLYIHTQIMVFLDMELGTEKLVELVTAASRQGAFTLEELIVHDFLNRKTRQEELRLQEEALTHMQEKEGCGGILPSTN